MDMLAENQIISHGQIFQARACRVCGARDSNSKFLEAHELRHKLVSEALAGMRRPQFLNGKGFRATSHGKCLDCNYVGKRVKERCQRCYHRHKAAERVANGKCMG